MSPLSRERLVVGLAPERLDAVRLGFWRRRRLAERSVPLAPSTAGAPWMAGLEALELLLDEPDWQARTLTVALSSHYVRYALLPRGKQLVAGEQDDLARVIFRKLFGELASAWEFRVSPGDGDLALASAVPTALLAALRTACEGRVTLGSVQPGLMSVFNRIRPAIGSQAGTLALVESSRITLATFGDGGWQAVSTRAWEPDALPGLLAESEALAAGPAGGRLWLCDLSGQAVAPEPPAWRVERLLSGPALHAWGLN